MDLKSEGQGLANWFLTTRTFLEDCQQDWVTMKMAYLLIISVSSM